MDRPGSQRAGDHRHMRIPGFWACCFLVGLATGAIGTHSWTIFTAAAMAFVLVCVGEVCSALRTKGGRG